MKPINTSLYDFPELIQSGYVYVDKTAHIYELARPNADRIYFLPRPRRFGKSLLLSTLQALFQGRRELFRGLSIDSLNWDWENEIYPVLHMDMSTVRSETADGMEANLNVMLQTKFHEFNLRFSPANSASANFGLLLNSLVKQSQNGKYVLLIDEYDSPISGLLDSEHGRRNLDDIRQKLHDFYIQAKANCGACRFMMVTGVSKFAKTSIFSAFNNPKDLTLSSRTADLLGYTHSEMEEHFHEHIQAFADERGSSYVEAFAELLQWYDSYQFSPDRLVKVINPVSLGNALSDRKLRNYWEATAGSTIIFDALKAKNHAPADFATEINVTTLDAADALTAPTEALLYQGGYLTIAERISDMTIRLKIPNYEVANSLQRGYMNAVLGNDFRLDVFQLEAENTCQDLATNGMTDRFKTMLVKAYSRLPHDWVCKNETEAKRHFMAFMIMAHADVASDLLFEPQFATGRPDAVISTDKGIYIFEFKYNASAKAAIKQCHDRNYLSRYVHETRAVFYVGVNYNPADNVRTIDEVLCEKVHPED